MAKKKGGYNKAKAKNLCKNLDTEVSNVQRAMKALNTDLEALQKGDGEVAFWSGERAYAWITNTLAFYDHNKVLLDHLDNCSEHLSNTVQGGSAL